MPDKVLKRKSFIINAVYIAIVCGLVFAFFKYLFWPAAPFVLSFLFAIMLQKPLRALDKKTKYKFHSGWSIILILLSICVIIVPLSLILVKLGQEIADFVKYAFVQLNDLPAFIAQAETFLIDLFDFLPETIYEGVKNAISNGCTTLIERINAGELSINLEAISAGLTSGFTGIYSALKNVPYIFVGLLIGTIAWIFFTKDYDKIVKFIQIQFPVNKRNVLVEFKQVFSKTVLKMLRAYSLIMLITFTELFISFSIMKLAGVMTNKYYVLIAIFISIFDILPALGSGGILVPWSIFSLITGNYKQAIGLIVIYIIMTVFRQYIEPKIVGTSLGVHPLVTLAGLYFGIQLFGVIGMFIVPITIMTLKAFNDTGRVTLWKTNSNQALNEEGLGEGDI